MPEWSSQYFENLSDELRRKSDEFMEYADIMQEFSYKIEKYKTPLIDYNEEEFEEILEDVKDILGHD